jgi:DNA-binding transcriptional MerR regulator
MQTMAEEPVVIPEKLYFKIGEVCDLVGVQAHVLRYWETEFSMLSPQKNKSGQRGYRKRDVEMALRIKQLLYKEMFTIAGARKKLQTEQREGTKPKAEVSEPALSPTAFGTDEAPTLFDNSVENDHRSASASVAYTNKQRDAMKTLKANLLEVRDILRSA